MCFLIHFMIYFLAIFNFLFLFFFILFVFFVYFVVQTFKMRIPAGPTKELTKWEKYSILLTRVKKWLKKRCSK